MRNGAFIRYFATVFSIALLTGCAMMQTGNYYEHAISNYTHDYIKPAISSGKEELSYNEMNLVAQEEDKIGNAVNYTVSTVTDDGAEMFVIFEQSGINMNGRLVYDVNSENHDRVSLPFEPVFNALRIRYVIDSEANLIHIIGFYNEIILEPGRAGFVNDLLSDTYVVFIRQKDTGLYVDSAIFEFLVMEKRGSNISVYPQVFVPFVTPLIHRDLNKIIFTTHVDETQAYASPTTTNIITFDMLTDAQIQEQVKLENMSNEQLMQSLGAAHLRYTPLQSRYQLELLGDNELYVLMTPFYNVTRTINKRLGTTLIIPHYQDAFWQREPAILLLSGELAFDDWFGTSDYLLKWIYTGFKAMQYTRLSLSAILALRKIENHYRTLDIYDKIDYRCLRTIGRGVCAT